MRGDDMQNFGVASDYSAIPREGYLAVRKTDSPSWFTGMGKACECTSEASKGKTAAKPFQRLCAPWIATRRLHRTFSIWLIRIYNMLPAHIVETSPCVKTFQSALQTLVKNRASGNCDDWEATLSPRVPSSRHPLRGM